MSICFEQGSAESQTEDQSALLEIQIENIRRKAFEIGYRAGFTDGYSRRALDDLNSELKEFTAKV